MTAVKETNDVRSLIVSVYGLYAREADGWLGVAALVRLLDRCGVDEPAVRSAVFRLKRRGLLVARRGPDESAGYALSAEGRTILDEGDRRIFARRDAAVGDGWLLAVFSVPESARDQRHQLRSRLARLGFGTVGAGVWIAPEHLLQETRHVLARQGLDVYVELFDGQHLGFTETAQRVPHWWDLPRLQALYDGFLLRHGPVLARWRRRRSPDDAQAFADYVTALTDWRRLPYADPGLPVSVLPEGWSGTLAEDTFFELRDRLETPAHRFADTQRA